MHPTDRQRTQEGVACMKNFMMQFWDDDRGQSTTEYILILSVVVMVAMKFKGIFQQRLTDVMGKVGGQIDSATSE